ncbi:NUDIX domain-containing protein [Psychroflexus sp. YR1-1]|uniref:NUDIX domain-containing protein n=1 Tax=Psychroflexus aurantiacus TaxID=2709310 RepID=A0A6B3R1G0_9FLAO|nr:NUDIX domain-containing protein [Psychroflexus aurantiacus]NEV94092.1 NUDIX domain-containing protein [Psychroflexus aurantiacus]
MYKVFVNDVPIILSTQENIGSNYTNIAIKKAKLKKLIRQIESGELTYLNLYHKNEQKLLKHLKRKLKVVVAGGGLVYNANQEILFIYRNKKWDLPKGKAEKGENIEETALREVEEETHVEGLKIVSFLQITYHIINRNDKYKLKETHWYEMKTDFTGELVPELSEGIKKAKWKDFEKTQKALQKSYANIKLLFPKEYLVQHPNDRVG